MWKAANPETSVLKHYTLYNIPENERIQVNRSKILRKGWGLSTWYGYISILYVV
jgi:hypothetical protein